MLNFPTITDVLKDEHELEAEDYYSLGKEIYDSFDEAAHKKGNGYACPGYPVFSARLEGLEEGLYLVCGESNLGKSAVMMNLILDYAMYKPNKLFAVYYSLDDSRNEIISRIIARNKKIPISVCAKPNRYESYIRDHLDSENTEEASLCAQYQEWLDKRDQGLHELREANERFIIFDREKVRTLDALLDHIKKIQMYVKSRDEEANVIVAIDSLADVVVDRKFSSDMERIDYVSMRVKEAANCDLKVPIFASFHCRKLNHSGRPTLDDVKQSSRLVYEASAVLMIFNDVSKNRQGASVFYTTPDSNEKLPIIEISFMKNKKSDFKGITFYYFSPQYSLIRETSSEEMQRLITRVYSK